MSEQLARSVLDHLRGQREAMVELLQQLALAESPSDNPAALSAVLALLADELKRAGMTVRRYRGTTSGGTLYARARQSGKGVPVQMLVGHCDTVWPIGTLRDMPVRLEGDTLRGPGVFDMKGGLVQMIFALRALHELRLSPPAECVAIINSDEETGSSDSRLLIRRVARRAVRAFVLEPAYGPAGKLKTERKGVGGFTVTITGISAHAGLNPEQGASAILELSHQIQRLFALNDPARGISVNVGTIGGGLRANVVAAEVRATVDVRVRTQSDADAVAAAIRGLTPVTPHTTIRVEGGFDHPPMGPSPRNRDLWKQARELGRLLGLELEDASVGGSSDGNTISQYTATLDGLGAVGDGAHASHEQVAISALPQRCALLVLLLLAPVPAEGMEGSLSGEDA
jgi:glutamate carboxypeptidase